jgi:alkane 1-monooxygenase
MNTPARFIPHLLSLSMILGYLTGTHWAFGMVGWIQLAVPLLDRVVGRDARRQPLRDEGADRFAALAIWSFLPVHIALIACGVLAVTTGFPTAPHTPLSVVQVAMAVGAIGGMCAAPVAHELMHRSGWLATAAAEMQMMLLTYPHFCIEHIEGHHYNVGTPADPVSARAGETLYQFYPRAVCGSLASAWRLEAARLKRAGVGPVHPRNRMIRYAAGQTIVYAVIGWLAGPGGAGFFALQSVIAFSIVETINYVEHYGLTRREVAPGCYEPVTPEHAWNSSHRISNWLLFNVAFHSDHHCDTGRAYSSLRHLDEAPQLPAGYFSMFVLALIPPLWHRVMDPRVDAWIRNRRPLEAA